MQFSLFNARTVNIFPASNTTNGGQLVTEFNLRALHSVDTNEDIEYVIGHSFTHNVHDFDISYDKTKGNAVFTIAPGRAIINGHYFETFAPIDVNIAEGNSFEVSHGGYAVDGELIVGLKMMYATNTTLIGEMDKDGNYIGVQVVVLPPRQFICPGDIPASLKDESVVTAHIRLGSIVYDERGIVGKSIIQNTEKTRYFDFSRIINAEKDLDGSYFSKKGLNPNRLYTVATKVYQDKDGVDRASAEFCDSVDSLMIWDSSCLTFSQVAGRKNYYDIMKYRAGQYPQATFLVTEDGTGVDLHIPHKPVDSSKGSHNSDSDFVPMSLPLPAADFVSGSPGIVTKQYTKKVRNVLNQIYTLQTLHAGNGIQRMFIEELQDREDLPSISDLKANDGDYIIVRIDTTIDADGDNAGYSWPSTMYIALPGVVNKIEYVTGSVSGKCLDTKDLGDKDVSSDPNIYNTYFDLQNYRGDAANNDYFTVLGKNSSGQKISARYKVTSTGKREWSNPVFITGQLELAYYDKVGGFLDVPSDDTHYMDGGYVGLDGDGHLKLLDYDLLRSGLLAYQLGSDKEYTGLDIQSLQDALDKDVNDRIAFPNFTSSVSGCNIINLTLELPDIGDESDTQVVEVRGIDSRFNTALYVHILGEAGPNVVIRFIDCEKLIIDSNMSNEFKIELYRCNLYYDSHVINRMSIIKNLSLWYEQFSDDDANLLVDGMTVREVKAAIPVEDVDYWSKDIDNDNHYQYALYSLTFDTDGYVVGVGLYMRDCSTRNNIPEGKHIIVSDIVLPHGERLSYPPSRFNRSITISGHFPSCYIPTKMSQFKVYCANIMFSIDLNEYDENVSKSKISGTISIVEDSYTISKIGGNGPISDGIGVSLPGIQTNEFHPFVGGVIG